MKNIFEVTYKIKDRGIEYPEQKREVIATNHMYIPEELHAYFRKNRCSMNLSNKFKLEIIGHEHIGWK